eukprot:2127617-Pleurochrysis_carterae.AAC.1
MAARSCIRLRLRLRACVCVCACACVRVRARARARACACAYSSARGCIRAQLRQQQPHGCWNETFLARQREKRLGRAPKREAPSR